MKNLADYYEAQDQLNGTQDSEFQVWFDERENDLRDEFLENAVYQDNTTDPGILDCSIDGKEFMAWAKDKFEKETK